MFAVAQHRSDPNPPPQPICRHHQAVCVSSCGIGREQETSGGKAWLSRRATKAPCRSPGLEKEEAEANAGGTARQRRWRHQRETAPAVLAHSRWDRRRDVLWRADGPSGDAPSQRFDATPGDGVASREPVGKHRAALPRAHRHCTLRGGDVELHPTKHRGIPLWSCALRDAPLSVSPWGRRRATRSVAPAGPGARSGRRRHQSGPSGRERAATPRARRAPRARSPPQRTVGPRHRDR